MNFFEHQSEARKKTLLLVLLFAASVLAIVCSVYVVLWFALPLADASLQWEFWNPQLFLIVALVTGLIVALGSLYKISQLKRGGGRLVAEMLGGQPLLAGSCSPLERRLLNVVEEMAIASGTPLPTVYLLEQPGINAFAAGFSPSEAVIGVTRGAIEMLSRDELQGVVAHEFSHILNGDMRMNMRLMGLLHGIMLIGDIGISLISWRRVGFTYRERSGYERGSPHFAIVILGLLLFAVGTIGLVFGDLIKRAISRQREFLADAAAVQFTRNPAGIAGALKTIGGYRAGSNIDHRKALQASHLFFGNALKGLATIDWWATHPPLVERIRRIDPRFEGELVRVDDRARRVASQNEALQMVGFAAPGTAIAYANPFTGEQLRYFDVDRLLARLGNPGPEHLRRAAELAGRMPNRLRQAAGEPFLARGIIFALLLQSEPELRSRQEQILKEAGETALLRELPPLADEVAALAPELRLPLADLCLPALRSMSVRQYGAFRAAVQGLIKVDGQLSLFEYTLHRLLLQHLDSSFGPHKEPEVRYHRLQELHAAVATVLAKLARVGAEGEARAAEYFAQGAARVQIDAALPPDGSLGQFDRALRQLRLAAPTLKGELVAAAIAVLAANRNLSLPEAELLRAVCDGMGVPMPPLLPGDLADS